jgi:hypothetical protein
MKDLSSQVAFQKELHLHPWFIPKKEQENI